MDEWGGGSRSLIGGMGVVGTGGCREASGDIVGGAIRLPALYGYLQGP